MTAAWVLAMAIWAAGAPTDFSARILAAHNAERSALGIPPLSWDEGLSRQAEHWAQYLAANDAFLHSTLAERGGTGENLWRGTAGYYSPEDMVRGWASEKRDFTFGTFPDVSLTGQPVGHYTQMIWRNTTEVGCGLATGHGWDVLVCRYSPPGNMIGERPY